MAHTRDTAYEREEGLGQRTGAMRETTGLRSEYERANMAPGNMMGGTRYEEQGMGQRTGEGVFHTRTTAESEPYVPNPATTNLPKEFESRVEIIEKVPEMKTVTKTDHVKRLEEREEMRTVPHTRVVQEEKEVTHMEPRVREVPRTREEVRHRVVEERVQVPYTEKIVEQVPVTKTETVPRIIREETQERVKVPHVTEVPVQRQVEVPTGRYCEQEVDHFTEKGAHPMGGHHLGGHHLGTAAVAGTTATTRVHRTSSSSSSSSSSDDETSGMSMTDKIKAKLPGRKHRHRTGQVAGATTGAGLATTGVHHTGTGIGHTGIGHTGTGVGHTGTGFTGTGVGGPITGTERSALANDVGMGHNVTGIGLTGTGTGTGVGHLTGTGTGVAPHVPGTTHPGSNLTGRPAPGEVGAVEHHEKKGFFKKIEEKLTGHHS